MKLNVEIDLENFETDFQESFAEVIKDEIKYQVKKELRKEIRQALDFKKIAPIIREVVQNLQDTAEQAIKEKLK